MARWRRCGESCLGPRRAKIGACAHMRTRTREKSEGDGKKHGGNRRRMLKPEAAVGVGGGRQRGTPGPGRGGLMWRTSKRHYIDATFEEERDVRVVVRVDNRDVGRACAHGPDAPSETTGSKGSQACYANRCAYFYAGAASTKGTWRRTAHAGAGCMLF